MTPDERAAIIEAAHEAAAAAPELTPAQWDAADRRSGGALRALGRAIVAETGE